MTTRNQTARPIAGWPEASAACGGGIRIGQIDSSRRPYATPPSTASGSNFMSFHKEGRRPGPADHGTAVAAMLVGKPTWGGLLPGAELFAANMFEINETGKIVGSGMGLLKAVDWLAGKSVQVVNLSVAGGDNKVVRTAFDRARDKGLVLVAAAGNWGTDKRPAYPAAYTDVIAVTAIDDKQQPYKNANRGAYIDFAAPGVRIYTAGPARRPHDVRNLLRDAVSGGPAGHAHRSRGAETAGDPALAAGATGCRSGRSR